MENLIPFMNGFVTNCNSNTSLAGILKQKFKEIPKPSISPEEYFYLTSLCDPYKEHIQKKHPTQEIDPEFKKKAAIGDKLHFIATKWFKEMDDFVSTESILDGFYVGLKTRGRLDAKIGDSIVELKTKEKENIPQTSEEVIQNWPHDVEQVAFYSVLDPTRPKQNYLIFMTQSPPYEFKVFKIEILNHDKIKELLQRRINTLQGVLLGKVDPSLLGRCRYCSDDCSIMQEGLCKPKTLNDLGCGIKDQISITEDENFKQELLNAIESTKGDVDFYKLFDLLAPRKYFNRYIKELDAEPFESDLEKKKNQAYLDHLLFNIDIFKLSRDDFSKINKSLNEKVHIPKAGWIKIRDSVHKDGRIVPFIAHSSPTVYQRTLEGPSNYKLAELAIMAFLHNKSKGLVFMYYPNLNDEFKVFEVEFNFYGDVKEKIDSIIKLLKEGNKDKFLELPECPEFMCRDCPHKSDCGK